MSQRRCYMFTVFFQEEEDPPLLPVEDWPEVQYCIYQLEMCPMSRRLHYQGYIELTTAKRITTLQSHYVGLERAHFEARAGTQEQAIAYCSKQESKMDGPWIHGVCKQQGKRNDLLPVKRAIDEGASLEQIAENHFEVWVKHSKAFKEYKVMKVAKRSWPMHLVLYLGPTRTGKSRKAFEDYPDAYWAPHDGWWDLYQGEETVVIDEMYGSRYSYSFLLRLTDRYPMMVPYKGGYHQFVSRRIVFTSNQEPKDWYDGLKTHQMDWNQNPLNARIREFGVIKRFGLIHQAPPADAHEDQEGSRGPPPGHAPEAAPAGAGTGVATREAELELQNQFYYDLHPLPRNFRID